MAYVGENIDLTVYKISRRVKNKNELIEKYYNLIQQANKNKSEIYPPSGGNDRAYADHGPRQ